MSSPDDLRAFSKAIDLLYSTLEDPSAWQTWASFVAGALGADGGNLAVVDLDQPQRSWIAQDHTTDEQMRTYFERFAAEDYQKQALDTLPIKRAYHSHDFSQGWRRGYFESRYYQEFAADTCMRTSLGSYVMRRGPVVASTGFHRYAVERPFGEREVDFLNALQPHIERALLQAEYQLFLEDALELGQRRSAAVYLLDSRGKVVYVNDAAAKLQADGDVAVCAQQVRLACRTSQAQLDDAIKQCLGGPMALPQAELFVRLERVSSPLPLVAAVSPNSRPLPFKQDVTSRVSVLIIVVDGATTPLLQKHLLITALGLTQQEERLVAHLAAGLSLKQAAAALDITYETARTYLKTVQRKTGLSSQASLVSFMARLAECRGSPRESTSL